MSNETVIDEQPPGEHGEGAGHAAPKGLRLGLISLTALGIVYGDIGTSPLYALRQCFHGDEAVRVDPINVLGVLSLIFWSLIIVISVKYLGYVMRADNRGEGGILALMALLNPWGDVSRPLVMIFGVFGAALLYGDSMITPAISVLSAVEGLEVPLPSFHEWVIPITCGILVVLFLFQKHGTARVGSIFGPVMLLWFAVLSVLGVVGIAKAPQVLAAVNPYYAFYFFVHNGIKGWLVMGAVFLVVTGGEALYADMGHFGSRPIRLAWFSLVLPALLLNYFGQGALVLRSPKEAWHPFYHLAPAWATYPLIALATVATIIASQAVISGSFSLTRQAVLLGEFPRLRIAQTSTEEIGQIYIASVNWVLMGATIALVLGFKSSSNLAAAYGVAVTTTMVITTILAFVVARERWHWGLPMALLVSLGFLIVDVAFFGANIVKILEGGWVPLAVAVAVFTVMSTWKRGRTILSHRLSTLTQPLESFLDELAAHPPVRVPGTAVVMTGRKIGTPPMLVHHLDRNQALHQQVVLLTLVTEEIPRVHRRDRIEFTRFNLGFFRVVARYGFMETPSVPEVLRACKRFELDIDPDEATYYVGRQNLVPGKGHGSMPTWRQRLFAFMMRNSVQPIAFYDVPSSQVVELGLEVEL